MDLWKVKLDSTFVESAFWPKFAPAQPVRDLKIFFSLLRSGFRKNFSHTFSVKGAPFLLEMKFLNILIRNISKS